MASRRISRNAKRMNSERGVSRFLASLKSTILLTLSELRTDEKFVEDFEQNLSSVSSSLWIPSFLFTHCLRGHVVSVNVSISCL